MKSLLSLFIFCCSLSRCVAAGASFEADGKYYSHEFLAACKPDEVRCLWFLDFRPNVAMVTVFDLRAQTVSSWREVFAWARQAGKDAPLSSVDLERVTNITKELKETQFKEDYFHCAFVALWRNEKLIIFRFDREGERGEFPTEFSQLLKVTRDAIKAKEETNRTSVPMPASDPRAP
jgi:hypothetical protein